MVVLYRRSDFSRQQFRDYLQRVHGPLAEGIPGLTGYTQNHAIEDSARKDPGWDAVVELSWNNREAMEASWRTKEGEAATADLPAFADMTRTTWSIVDEQVRR
jgi:uncharacterized protein (TIGR02118 family)